MNVKKLLKFYFKADGLNEILDGIIFRYAMKTVEGGGVERQAGKIYKVIDVKRDLGGLWRRLDGVIAAMTERDRAALERYAGLRAGTSSLDTAARRELHRAVVKFTRRAAGLLRGGEKLFGVLGEYVALL